MDSFNVFLDNGTYFVYRYGSYVGFAFSEVGVKSLIRQHLNNSLH